MLEPETLDDAKTTHLCFLEVFLMSIRFFSIGIIQDSPLSRSRLYFLRNSRVFVFVCFLFPHREL